MPRLFLLLACLLANFELRAVSIGDSYEQVVAEKGNPKSQVKAGKMQILNYDDASIRLRDGVVYEIKTPAEARGPLTRTAEAPPTSMGPVLTLDTAQPVVTMAEAVWTTDYAAALEQAKAENKQVLVFFTGSDWCGWCKRLEIEVLNSGTFVRYANERLILVKLDFPKKTPQDPEIKARNFKLQAQYKIEGYPTLFLLGPDGAVQKKLGYQPGGPVRFLEEIKS